jgi:hypothetical protein
MSALRLWTRTQCRRKARRCLPAEAAWGRLHLMRVRILRRNFNNIDVRSFIRNGAPEKHVPGVPGLWRGQASRRGRFRIYTLIRPPGDAARASFRSCSRFPICLHRQTGAGIAPCPTAETKGLRCVEALLLYQTCPAVREQNMPIRKNNVS